MAHKRSLFSSLASSCLSHLVNMNVTMNFLFKITVLSIFKVRKLSKNIKPADKDSATVIMSQEDCVTEAMRQLNKEEHYRQLDQDPTLEYTTQLLGEMKDHHLSMNKPGSSVHHSMRQQQYSTYYPRFTNQVTLADQSCPHVGHQQRRFPNLGITTYTHMLKPSLFIPRTQ